MNAHGQKERKSLSKAKYYIVVMFNNPIILVDLLIHFKFIILSSDLQKNQFNPWEGSKYFFLVERGKKTNNCLTIIGKKHFGPSWGTKFFEHCIFIRVFNT